jgi:trehalose 6-phosphate phosphatase
MVQPPAPASYWCLFLDFDGTLVELQRHPDEVIAPATLVRLLVDLREALDGAVAIINGRSVANLETMLAPLRLPIAGV